MRRENRKECRVEAGGAPGGGGWVSTPQPPTGNPIALICSADRSGGCAGVCYPSGRPRVRKQWLRREDWTMRGARPVLLVLVLAACSGELGEGCRQRGPSRGEAGRGGG